MNELFPNLGKPRIKSIEIFRQIVGGIKSSFSVPVDLLFLPYCIETHHIQPQNYERLVSYHPRKNNI
jgi:hypothetical protein